MGRIQAETIAWRASEQTSERSFLTREFGEPTKTRKQMAVETSTGALALHNEDWPAINWPAINWHAINWQRVLETVRRLQGRIVKATKEGRRGKAKALQHLRTHSFCSTCGPTRSAAPADPLVLQHLRTHSFCNICGPTRSAARLLPSDE
jgi:hypothetical protein